MSDAVLIAIVVVVLVLLALAVVAPRIAARGRTPQAGGAASAGPAGARRVGDGASPQGSATGGEPAREPDADRLAERHGAEEAAVGGRGRGGQGDGSAPVQDASAPAPSDARARARELQWGEDRDFEWVDTRGTRPTRRFERERTSESRPERRR